MAPHHQREREHRRHTGHDRRGSERRPPPHAGITAQRGHQHGVVVSQRVGARPLSEHHLELRDLLTDRSGDIQRLTQTKVAYQI